MITNTYRLDNVCSFKEAIFSACPEGEMALSVCNEEVIVQGMEGSSRQILL